MFLCWKESHTKGEQVIQSRTLIRWIPRVTFYENKIHNQQFVLMSLSLTKSLDLLSVAPLSRQSLITFGVE